MFEVHIYSRPLIPFYEPSMKRQALHAPNVPEPRTPEPHAADSSPRKQLGARAEALSPHVCEASAKVSSAGSQAEGPGLAAGGPAAPGARAEGLSAARLEEPVLTTATWPHHAARDTGLWGADTSSAVSLCGRGAAASYLLHPRP